MKNYIWALDLSLKSTGVAIFTNDGKCVYLTSIETKAEDTTQKRLSYIGEELIRLTKNYPANKILIEQGFTRFNKSTQQIFRVHGVVNYIFSDIEQIYYPSLTIRKIVMGKGNMKKEEIRKIVTQQYPKMKFNTLDESDAFIIGLAYFIERQLKEGVLGNA